ncbi:MAG: hypothetical protein HC901_00605 [Bdellovibrionaceae bacterium]|nr:hypothetical protein [Pseudobdellovibrionaceae bacterium]
MRRIKVPAVEKAAVYHCVTRTVNGEFLFDDQAKEMLRKHLRQAERFCGVEILTFCILSNHFHVLVKVPQLPPSLADTELLARYRALYPKPTKFQQASLAVIADKLQSGGPEAAALRSQLLSRMNDVSEFHERSSNNASQSGSTAPTTATAPSGPSVSKAYWWKTPPMPCKPWRLTSI